MIKYDSTQISDLDSNAAFYLELVCNIFFLIEMLIRIITMGLFLEKKTFLRDAFQMLDFIVTIAR